MPPGAIVFNAPGTYSVSASIDHKCNPQNTTFTIAQGLTAKSFKIKELKSGRKCVTGEFIDYKGFNLKGNGVNYRWFRFRDNPPSETGGTLATLTLGAGTYTLSVDGGEGAYVELEFEVVKPVPPKGNLIGTFTGYVRTSKWPYTVIESLEGCRVIVLNASAPGLLEGGRPGAGKPAQVCDRLLGPATIFADYYTDSEGFYKISLPVGKYKVLFWAPGYVYKIYTINIRGE
jgi:hypothetical protein